MGFWQPDGVPGSPRQVSGDGATWRPVDGGQTFLTGVQPKEEGAVFMIEFVGAVSARYVKLSVDSWESHISLRCGLLVRSGSGHVEEVTVMPSASPVRRAVINCGTLPAVVAATHIPGGAPAAWPVEWAPGDVGLDHAPTGRCSWKGRQMEWEVIDLNGSTARTAVTRPSQECSIEVAWRAWWRYDNAAYCPGCVVQLYFGMSDDLNNNVGSLDPCGLFFLPAPPPPNHRRRQPPPPSLPLIVTPPPARALSPPVH